MDNIKALVGLAGTAVIAGWVAYAVSAPRNVDSYMNQPMQSLDGKSINETMAETKAQARAEQCEQFTEIAQKAWDRAVEQGTLDRDADKLDEYDRQRDRYCN